MAHPFDLSGRRALVTGGGGGLGLAMARGLGQAGARVVINGRSRDKLDAAVSALQHDGIDASTAIFDVSDVAAVDTAIVRLERDAGAFDIVINNAAMNQRAALDAFSVDDWRRLMAANLDAPFFVAKSVIPGMRARRRGKIINICSLASEIGRPNIVPYAVSKGGLQMLTRALAVELAPHNVQVNGIAPGFFRTDMNAPLIANAEFSAWVANRTPAGRWGEPPEIAGAAVFLASSSADYVTGHVLFVDGGFSVAY
jgi:gluconate 5-dehydrogenase